MDDEDIDVRRDAAEALGEIEDERAVEPLIQNLKDKNIRSEVIYALGKIGDERAVDPLIQALGNRRVREDVAEALGKIGDARAVQPLMKRFITEEMDTPFTFVVAEAIGLIGDKRAVEGLIRALEKPSLRVQTALALGHIGDKRAVRPLEELLNNLLSGYDPFAFVDDYEGQIREENKICAAVKEALEKIKKQ